MYGVPSDNLVLLPEDLARAIADDRALVYGCRTYGDARKLVTQHEWVPGLDDEDLNEPYADDRPYDPTETREASNGHWPSRAATIASRRERYCPVVADKRAVAAPKEWILGIGVQPRFEACHERGANTDGERGPTAGRRRNRRAPRTHRHRGRRAPPEKRGTPEAGREGGALRGPEERSATRGSSATSHLISRDRATVGNPHRGRSNRNVETSMTKCSTKKYPSYKRTRFVR